MFLSAIISEYDWHVSDGDWRVDSIALGFDFRHWLALKFIIAVKMSKTTY